MKISEILAEKGIRLLTIAPEATLVDAAQELFANRVGALMVVDLSGSLVGIVTERDIVRVLAQKGSAAVAMSVRQVMTAEVVSAKPEDDVEDARTVMTERRIRHLPVLEDGILRGLVSIGDVLKVLRDEYDVERRDLDAYISGKYLNS